jgi:ATP dependent DNA ligase domain
VQPIIARPTPDLPIAGPWAFEPKFDGFRAIATTDRGRVRLYSRQYRPLTRCFPEIVAAIAEQFGGHVVLDGELVVCPAGRLDFMALQRRLKISRFMVRNMPRRLIATRRSNSSSETSTIGLRGCSTPALLNAMSRRPIRPVTTSSAASTSSARDTSQASARACPPSCFDEPSGLLRPVGRDVG